MDATATASAAAAAYGSAAYLEDETPAAVAFPMPLDRNRGTERLTSDAFATLWAEGLQRVQ